MTIVIEIDLAKPSHQLHYQLHEDIIDMISKRNVTVLNAMELTPWLPPYYTAFHQEKDALDTVTRSKYTRPMSQKDHERKDIYRGFESKVKNFLGHFDPEVDAAAERVSDIFKYYGDVPRKGYDEETAVIDDLLREFEGDDFIEDLKTLKVLEWCNRLEAVHMDFKELRALRVAEKATMTTSCMKEARMETDRRYRDIVTHVEYMIRADKSSQALVDFVNELNALLKSYKDMLAHAKYKSHYGENETDE